MFYLGYQGQIQAIADNYLMLYQQSNDLWTHELDLRPHQERF